MKAVIKTLTKEGLKHRDYYDEVEISINGERIFSIYDDRIEGNHPYRKPDNPYDIAGILKQAYNAGKNGEELKIEEIKLDGF